MMRIFALAAIALVMPITTAAAQTIAPTAQPSIANPLRPAQPAFVAPAQTAQQKVTQPVATQPGAEPAKPKRERSAKQKQGDDDMRACGASWRADKDALKAKGQTWRTYLKECRGQKKTARGA